MATEERILLDSNLGVYFEIAIKAQAKSEKLEKRYTKPIPGQPGRFVHHYDPGRGSFKNALIAIVFSGVFIDALLSVEAMKEPERLKKKHISMKKYDFLKYEQKLKILGVSDEKLLEDCKEFREGRNEVVHEKPMEVVGGKIITPIRKLRIAQKEAAFAVDFIKRVISALSIGAESSKIVTK